MVGVRNPYDYKLAERLQVRVAVRGAQLLGGVHIPGGDEPGGVGA